MKKWLGLLILLFFSLPLTAAFDKNDLNNPPLLDDLQETQRSNDLCERVLLQNWNELTVDGFSYSLRVATNPFNKNQRYFELLTKKLKKGGIGFERDPETGQEIEFSYQAGRDARTGGISARSEQGEIVFDVLLRHIKQHQKKAVFLYIDVNSLELVNHFKGKDGDGDLYLERVGHVIMDKLRDMDLLFRIGGDELAVLLPGVSAENAFQIMQRIQDALFQDREANNIFERQLSYRRQQIGVKIKSFEIMEQKAILAALDQSFSTSEEFLEDLKLDLRQNSQNDRELEALLVKYDQERRLKPTVSMGAVFIKPQDDFNTLKLAASTIAGRNKVEYKMAIGMSVVKYEISTKPIASSANYQNILPALQSPIQQ